MDSDSYSEPVPVPRGGIRLPLELRPPDGFNPEEPATWPEVKGRLEWVGGKLLYMPPSGDDQQDVASAVTAVLWRWRDVHPDFIVGSNEAGMLLEGEIRAADVAVWHKSSVPVRTGGYRRAPPVLAVEVAGRDEEEAALRQKAAWYLGHGVQRVWLVLPRSREVLSLDQKSELRSRGEESLHAPELPGLSGTAGELFVQLD